MKPSRFGAEPIAVEPFPREWPAAQPATPEPLAPEPMAPEPRAPEPLAAAPEPGSQSKLLLDRWTMPAADVASVVGPTFTPPSATPYTSESVPAGGDHDNRTRASANPRRPRVAGQREILQVNAVRCADGHANPPTADRCRACGRLIDEDAPRFEMAQPTVGHLRQIPGETEFPLRGRVLVGREPRLERRDTVLSDAGNLTDVTFFPVVSMTGLVSRTHIEVRVTGWTVEVIDLSSTHTVVTNPGGQPIRLRSQVPTVIVPDARIVLGDEITLIYTVVD